MPGGRRVGARAGRFLLKGVIASGVVDHAGFCPSANNRDEPAREPRHRSKVGGIATRCAVLVTEDADLKRTCQYKIGSAASTLFCNDTARRMKLTEILRLRFLQQSVKHSAACGIVPFVVELCEWRTPCFGAEVVYSTPRQQPHRRAGPARPGQRPGSAGRGNPAPAGSAAPPPPARSLPSVESSARRATA